MPAKAGIQSGGMLSCQRKLASRAEECCHASESWYPERRNAVMPAKAGIQSGLDENLYNGVIYNSSHFFLI